MRIISKFKDYYDNLSMYGIDMTQVFVRNNEAKTMNVQLTPNDKNLLDLINDIGYYFNNYRERLNFKEEKKGKDYELKLNIVFFCGELYPFFVAKKFMSTENDKIYFLYDENDVNKIQEEQGVSFENYGNIFSALSGYSRNKGVVNAIKYVRKCCSDKKIKDFFENYAIENKIAYFNIKNIQSSLAYKRSIEIEEYPILKNIEFYKTKEGVEVFQELEQYLFGKLLINKKEMIEISDEIKASKYGHDGKYSFKTPPKEK